MKTLAALLFLIPAIPGCGALADTQGPDAPLDVAGVDSVVVTGDASRLTLSTDAAEPFAAALTGRRSGFFQHWLTGWSSSWFSDDCRSTGRMTLEGTRLLVDVAEPFGLSDCRVELRANLPVGAALSVDQNAVLAVLDGDFSSVRIASKAADVSLDGHAREVVLTGEAMRTRLDFRTVRREESVVIDAKALDASLRFAEGNPIDYAVDATASFVDSALADTPGAKPSVRIKGEFVRATIR